MKILAWIAYAAWALAAFVLFIALDGAELYLITVAISLAISGVLFFAFERVISLLTDIRDTLRSAPQDEATREASDTPQPRPVDEITADLERLKEKHPRDAQEEAWQRLEEKG